MTPKEMAAPPALLKPTDPNVLLAIRVAHEREQEPLVDAIKVIESALLQSASWVHGKLTVHVPTLFAEAIARRYRELGWVVFVLEREESHNETPIAFHSPISF